MTAMTATFGEPIYTYTAEQAEEDGALVRGHAELTKAPVYLGRALFENIEVPAGWPTFPGDAGRPTW
jgi:hypothetical protein